MPFCGNCGSKLPDGAKFCGVCGTPVAAPANHEPAPTPAPTPEPAPVSKQPQPQPAASTSAQGPVPIVSAPAHAPEQAPAPAPEPTPAPAPATFQQPDNPQQAVAPQQPSFQQAAAPQQTPSQPSFSTQSFSQQAQSFTQSAQNVMNQAQQAMPPQAQEFFSWLWQSFLHPSQNAPVQTWWSVVAFAINGFLLALYPFVMAVQAVSAFNGGVRGFASSYGYSGYTPQVNIPIGILFKGWIMAFAFFYLMVLIVFIGYRIKGDTTSFAILQQKVAQRFMPACAVSLVAILFSFMGTTLAGLGGVLYAAAYVLMAALPGVMIAQATSVRKLDSVWLWILAAVIGGVLLFILMLIVAGMGISDASSGTSSFFSGLSNMMDL